MRKRGSGMQLHLDCVVFEGRLGGEGIAGGDGVGRFRVEHQSRHPSKAAWLLLRVLLSFDAQIPVDANRNRYSAIMVRAHHYRIGLQCSTYIRNIHSNMTSLWAIVAKH